MTGSPTHCDCFFKELAHNLTQEGIDLKARCVYPPHMHGKDWREIDPQLFLCKPNIMGCRRKNVLVQLGTSVQVGRLCLVKIRLTVAESRASAVGLPN